MPAFSVASHSPWRPPALTRLLSSAMFAAVCAATLTGVAAALVWHPLLILIAVPITMGWIAGLAFGPLAFLCFMAATAGFGFAWVEGLGLTVVGRPVNPNGLHWGITIGIAVLLLARFRAGPLPKVFRPYAAFVLLSAFGLAWAPDWFDGLKQVLLYGLPLLLGWLAYRTVRTRKAIEWLTMAWWAGLAFSSVVAVAMASAELPSYPGLGGVLGSRGFAMHLLPFFALALAGARERLPGRGMLAAAIGALALLTLSRMAVAVMLALGFFAFLAGRGQLRVVGVLGVVLLGSLALQFGPLRERIFVYEEAGFTGWKLEVVGRGLDSELSFGNINLSGRGLAWLQTWEHAKQAPFLGHGTGAATVFLERDLATGISHPHNDYLRVLHDLGVIGLALLLYTCGFVLVQLRRLQRAASSAWSREWTEAAALAWGAYLLMALTDNSMMYATFFSGTIFMLIALALRAVELDQGTHSIDPLAGRGVA